MNNTQQIKTEEFKNEGGSIAASPFAQGNLMNKVREVMGSVTGKVINPAELAAKAKTMYLKQVL